ncbi:MAG: hypothetical protein PVI57_21940 [Gemmatimonadota bacterium]|jgi:hypothetical protein
MRARPPAPVTAFLLAFLLACGPAAHAGGQDFEAEYESLIEDFLAAVPDTAALEALDERSDSLTDRIRGYRSDHRADLSDEELDRLGDLASEVAVLDQVIRVVGQLSNSADVEIEDFDAVNRRLELEPRVLQTHESGLEIVRIDIGSFGSMLLRNPTTMTFQVDYETNDADRPYGFGSADCQSYSVMSGLFNSRDRDLENIELTLTDVEDSGLGTCG